ncbi:MAG: DUF2442 domain-containing protein [Spirosomataceae bacterium]
MIPKPIKVQSIKKYLIELMYSDGVVGTVDLSHLAHQGVFSLWEKEGIFENVYIDKETKAIAWNDEVDLCPDALYFTLKNTSFTQWKESQSTYAYH